MRTPLHTPPSRAENPQGAFGALWFIYHINFAAHRLLTLFFFLSLSLSLFFFFFLSDPWGGDIAQLVQRPTEKPDAIPICMKQVRVPSEARDFSLRVDFQWRLSYGVRTAPVRYRMLQHLCAR